MSIPGIERLLGTSIRGLRVEAIAALEKILSREKLRKIIDEEEGKKPEQQIKRFLNEIKNLYSENHIAKEIQAKFGEFRNTRIQLYSGEIITLMSAADSGTETESKDSKTQGYKAFNIRQTVAQNATAISRPISRADFHTLLNKGIATIPQDFGKLLDSIQQAREMLTGDYFGDATATERDFFNIYINRLLQLFIGRCVYEQSEQLLNLMLEPETLKPLERHLYYLSAARCYIALPIPRDNEAIQTIEKDLLLVNRWDQGLIVREGRSLNIKEAIKQIYGFLSTLASINADRGNRILIIHEQKLVEAERIAERIKNANRRLQYFIRAKELLENYISLEQLSTQLDPKFRFLHFLSLGRYYTDIADCEIVLQNFSMVSTSCDEAKQNLDTAEVIRRQRGNELKPKMAFSQIISAWSALDEVRTKFKSVIPPVSTVSASKSDIPFALQDQPAFYPSPLTTPVQREVSKKCLAIPEGDAEVPRARTKRSQSVPGFTLP